MALAMPTREDHDAVAGQETARDETLCTAAPAAQKRKGEGLNDRVYKLEDENADSGYGDATIGAHFGAEPCRRRAVPARSCLSVDMWMCVCVSFGNVCGRCVGV